MAVEGATEALVAAFFFGIVLNAASAALVLYLRGHGLAAVFRDSQRLVLVLFLFSAALWAQIDFIAILLDTTTSSTPCQIGLIFSTIFDQFARFSIEQFLLWALNNNNGSKLSVMQLVPQVLVLARFLAGAVFIGFIRPQTDTFCVATTSALPVGIVVAALDGVIVLLLLIRTYSAGNAAKDNRGGKGVSVDRAGALMSVVLGLAFWTGTSVPLLIGIKTLALATRTALPAGGLLVLIALVAGGAGALSTPRATGSRPPEAPSPRRINISRDISTSDTDYPPSRFEDLKEAAIRSSTTFVNPREAPRVKDETSIGFPFEMAQTMPPLPPNSAQMLDAARNLDKSAPHKRSFDFSKGKIAISHPILQENASQNPWSKIAVMDLQAAAVAERQRRARMQEEESMAAVSRSAGPMGMTPQEMLKRGVSLKRKDVASISTQETVFPGMLQPEDMAVAMTTATQLSPGGEETRRRSPRPSLQEESVQPRPRQPSAVQTVEPAITRSDSQQSRPLTILQPHLKANIRPSRVLPPSPKAPPPEPTKTPLQRRPTIGLPSNPRARGLEVSEDPGSQHRTILFLNNIEYKDPHIVDAIVKTAGNPVTKPAPAAETPGTSGSVVNRPRPIPRKPADSSAQSSPAFAHRRSKSSGSLIGRKSLLSAYPGSPTQLPPLPSIPRSATMPSRPHPNDTKSMTFEEKVTLLFPTPPSANAIKRRSSVPDVPRIPASYLDIDSSPSEPSDRQTSDRTTKTSIRTEDVSEVDEIPRLPARAMVTTTDEAGSSWVRAFGNKPSATQSTGKRGSSPVIPPVQVRASAWTETTYDDDATNWSAMNTPEVGVGIPVMHRLGLPASIQMPARQDTRGSQLTFADNRSRETLPIMLDDSTYQPAEIEAPVVPEPEVVATPELPTWHRRVGDECPTFSDRKKAKARKMPPPAPLSLNTNTRKKILAIHVEPSPLESPGQAIRQIQSQLKKLDEVEPSPQSAARRLALLEDLEREMGQQADHWQEIKHDMSRDSMSSMQTTSPTERSSRHASVASTVDLARDSFRQSIGADRRASRLSRMRIPGNPTIPEEGPSVRNSGSPQLSKWQKRLTEAQLDYMDAQLLRNSNFNLMQLSKAQLASPTPPDSDHSFEDEVPPLPSAYKDVTVEQPLESQRKPSTLWTPTLKETTVNTGFLWTPVSKSAPEPEALLPGLSVRPPQRKMSAPLHIQSSQLWRKPYNTANRSTSGIWRPLWASAAPPAEPLARAPSKSGTAPQQKPPRPVTQRPPRRNKRVTLLPDILESPQPLPDKRGTLGIFQFPWGEKSDTASIQPRASMYMAMPGTMTTGGPPVRYSQPESTEYSSSFFDDYDDEDDFEMDSDEDSDDFDETTLWEIASLLKTDAVPSRSSLLPPSNSADEDYLDDLDSDEEGQSSREHSIVIALDEPREMVLEQQRDSATIDSTTLQMLENAIKSTTPPESPPKTDIRIGLPANPKASLNRQVSHAADVAASEVTPASAMSRMLGHTAEVEKVEIVPQQGSTGLWNPPSQTDRPTSQEGLFVPGSRRTDYRTTIEEPAAKYIIRKPRPVEQKPLERLTSTKPWGLKNSVTQTGLWFPPRQASTPSPRGALFMPGPSRRPKYRGTTKEPAAKYMNRRPRVVERKPLERLTSTELWAAKNSAKQSTLWRAPRQVEAPSSGVTLFVPGSRRYNYRGTTEEPAAKYISRKPRPVEQKALDRLASTKLWVSGAAGRRSERNWILGVKLKTRGSRTQRLQASPSDWKAALNEAIKASYPATKTKRVAATPAHWDAALQEAISLSTRAPAFNSSVRHPVFAASSLVTRSERFHPAATGYTYDVATVHPVFFGSLAIACPEDAVHPAISAYAAKKLRRQRSSRQRSSESRSRSRSISQSSGRRKDEIRAQIRALEQQKEREEEGEMLGSGVYNPNDTPLKQEVSNTAIQAQIEALEQERLFAERAAKEEYRRRTTMTSALVEPPQQQPVAVEDVMPAGADTVQDLQRHLSWQIRQSLVFASAVNVPEPEPRIESLSRSGSKRKTKTVSFAAPVSTSTSTSTSTKSQSTSSNSLLWTPAHHHLPQTTYRHPSPGLWSSTPSKATAKHKHIPSTTPTTEAQEDALAASQRARRRLVMQKRQRRQEILAQIAAVESGANPFVDFAGMEMWSRAVERRSGRDWLHSVCVWDGRGGLC